MYLEGVLINKGGISIEVVHLLLSEGNTVTPVQRADVVLNALHHLAPGVAHLLWRLPAELPGVLKERTVCVRARMESKGREEERKKERKKKTTKILFIAISLFFKRFNPCSLL